METYILHMRSFSQPFPTKATLPDNLIRLPNLMHEKTWLRSLLLIQTKLPVPPTSFKFQCHPEVRGPPQGFSSPYTQIQTFTHTSLSVNYRLL